MNRHKNLHYKDYSFRKLTALPELPPNLEVLDCHKNELTALPELYILYNIYI